MYLAEVLNKLPVIQHFLFGSILPYTGPVPPQVAHSTTTSVSQQPHVHGFGPDGEDNVDAHWGHAHTLAGGVRDMGWGDCCGIPVPSAFAAAKAEKERQPGLRLEGTGIRPVPFD